MSGSAGQLGRLTSIDGIEVMGVRNTCAPDNEEYSANAVADSADFVHMPADRETGRDPGTTSRCVIWASGDWHSA